MRSVAAGIGAAAVAALLLPSARAEDAREAITAERRAQLVRIVRQDCGACHGMQLTGGLGPALTPAALADKPLAATSAAIFHGRPGTPMPGWRPLISAAEADWIAAQLAAGFPAEARPAR